jgi:hypothetical protein
MLSVRFAGIQMSRRAQGYLVAFGVIVIIAAMLAMAVAWGTKSTGCVLAFPKIIGCALAQYESLSGGLIAAGGALFGGWLAWSAVREQVQIEKRKVKAAEFADQSRIADEISRDLFDLKVAHNAGRSLLRRLNEELKDPSPYANRFLDMWCASSFPTTPGTWSPKIVGDELWNLVNRLKALANLIDEEIRRSNPIQRNSILQSREPAASDLVAEFNSSVELLQPLIDQRQQALTDANAKLEELRRGKNE